MSGFFGVEHDVADAGVRADRQHRVPRLAAVGRLVEAALAAGRPQRALRGDVDDVRVARIDRRSCRCARTSSRPTLLPGLAGVGRLVDAVAEVRAALAGVLAGADPDDVRVLRIDDDAAEGERALLVEDGRERDAAVGRLPQPAERATRRTRRSGFFGSISTSWMRPVASAGPRLRSSRPLRLPASSELRVLPANELRRPSARHAASITTRRDQRTMCS